MQVTGADRYRGSIPGQPQNSRIDYFVEAVDEQGARTRSRVYSFRIAERLGGSGCGCASGGSGSIAAEQGRGATLVQLVLLLAIVWGLGRKQGRS